MDLIFNSYPLTTLKIIYTIRLFYFYITNAFIMLKYQIKWARSWDKSAILDSYLFYIPREYMWIIAELNQKGDNYHLRQVCLKYLSKLLQNKWLWVKKWLHRIDHSVIEKLNFANRKINTAEIAIQNFKMIMQILKKVFFKTCYFTNFYPLFLIVPDIIFLVLQFAENI